MITTLHTLLQNPPDPEDYIGPYYEDSDADEIVKVSEYYYGANAIIVLGDKNHKNDTILITRSLLGDSLQIKKMPGFGLFGIGKLWLEDVADGMINFRLLFLNRHPMTAGI